MLRENEGVTLPDFSLMMSSAEEKKGTVSPEHSLLLSRGH